MVSMPGLSRGGVSVKFDAVHMRKTKINKEKGCVNFGSQHGMRSGVHNHCFWRKKGIYKLGNIYIFLRLITNLLRSQIASKPVAIKTCLRVVLDKGTQLV